jgi:hypothetical protein
MEQGTLVGIKSACLKCFLVMGLEGAKVRCFKEGFEFDGSEEEFFRLLKLGAFQ